MVYDSPALLTPHPLLSPKIASKARALDEADVLKSYKDLFHLPHDVIYLDGNSLGAMVKTMPDVVAKTVQDEFGNGLIRSWNDAGWVDLPQRIGNRLANILGADAGEMIMTDTISINLYKVISYALSMTDKTVILVENSTFPSDIYVADGVAQSRRGITVRPIPDNADTNQVIACLTDDLAVAVLSDVNFKTSYVLDMEKINAVAKEKGILVIWDLAHSAGALDVNLKRDGALMAVGCTYKYLNGGPGSPAFVYVSKSLQGKGHQPVSGWFSHQNMFAMSPDYVPAPDIRQFQTGTFSPVAYVAAEQGIKIWETVDMQALREKSLAMTDFFLELMEPVIQEHNFGIATPLDHRHRGSHVSLTDPERGFAIVQALIARGVIGDYRDPDIMRFGFAPLYLSFTDIAKAAAHYKCVMDNQEWKHPEFNKRGLVT